MCVGVLWDGAPPLCVCVCVSFFRKNDNNKIIVHPSRQSRNLREIR